MAGLKTLPHWQGTSFLWYHTLKYNSTFVLFIIKNNSGTMYSVLQNTELHNLYSSPNIIRQIKSRRMRWVGYVAYMGEGIKVYKVWWESLKERDYSED
jgi:hypothetical protein